MSNIKLKIEIPGVTASEVSELVEGGRTGISRDGYVECTLPWIQGKGEIRVRHVNFPLQSNGETIYVRNVTDIKKFTSIRSEGGIAKLLGEFEADEIIFALEARLRNIREKLLVDTIRCIYLCA